MPPKRKADNMPANKAAVNKKKYGMAPLLPVGEHLVDYTKKQWILGHAFASGGFGRIYYAKPASDSTKKEDFVIKMEPAENGPLFQEFHMYNRIGRLELIEQFRRKHGLTFLGVPVYYGSGIHVKNAVTFRFLVLPRFGQDVEKLRESQAGGRFENAADVGRLALTCLNAFSYLHAQNTVHADLKGENLLFALDCSPESKNLHKVFLVDFGLARRVPDDITYKESTKKAHEGTLIFTSLDAHKGCSPVYRDDVEILAYNLIFWLRGTLPWIDKLPEQVLKQKVQLAASTDDQLTTFLYELENSQILIDYLVQFLNICYGTDYTKRPDYAKLKTITEKMIEKWNMAKKSISGSASLDSTKRISSNISRTIRNRKADSSSEGSKESVRLTKRCENKKPIIKRLDHSKVNEARESNSRSVQNNKQQSPDAAVFRRPFDFPSEKSTVERDIRRPKAVDLAFVSEDTSDDDLFKPARRRNGAVKKERSSRDLFDDETDDVTTADEDTAIADRDTVPKNENRTTIPGVANLKNRCDAKALKVPANAFRRRQSIEASLINKYRKLVPNQRVVKKIDKILETTDASSENENEDESTTKKRDKMSASKSRAKNVETQTSPNAFERFVASRRRNPRRRCML